MVVMPYASTPGEGSGVIDALPQRRGGLGVSAGYGVGVAVQGGGHAAVVEAAGDDGEGDAGVEHLGGHEVAEVVQPELPQPGGASGPQERFGGAVRFPRRGSAGVVAEHECLGQEESRLAARQRAAWPRRAARVPGSRSTEWRRLVLVSARTGPWGPSTHPAVNETRPVSRATPCQRSPSSWARRAPVKAASITNSRNTWSWCTASRSGRSSSGVGGCSSGAEAIMRWARSAGLSQIQPHRCAWDRAERSTTCTRATVPVASGAPRMPP